MLFLLFTLSALLGTAGSVDSIFTSASFQRPVSVRMDSTKTNVIVADASGNRIRLLNLATSAVTTLMGTGVANSVDGIATSATINFPCGAVQDTAGSYYFSEYNTGKIRKLAAGSTTTTTVAYDYFNYYPQGLTVDHSGNVIIADRHGYLRILVGTTMHNIGGVGKNLSQGND